MTDPSKQGDDGGVRRRRSLNDREGDGEMTTDDDGVQVGTRTLSTSHRTSLEHRVRFSLDLEPGSMEKKKQRKSDESYPSRVPDLSIHPGTSHDSAQPPPASSSGWARGISMRSSLFMRNMRERSPGGIELTHVGPFDAQDDVQSRPQAGKKNGRTSVTITPIDNDVWQPKPVITSSPALRGHGSLVNYRQWMSKHARALLPLQRIEAAYETARKFILRIQDIPPSKDGRHIALDPSRKTPLIDGRTNKPYVSNSIRSSKYTPWNFLPRQVFAQFSKLANAYFLAVSILQMIPGLSTTGTYTTIVPLLFFVSLSMAKEGYEDLRRHRLDKAENNHEAKVLRLDKPPMGVEKDRADGDADVVVSTDGTLPWTPVKWQSLSVGDVVELKRDEPVPADIVLLSATGPNNTAYIETMALDGETNLKPKQPSARVLEAVSTTAYLLGSRIEVVVEDPSLDLYSFEGRITVDGKTSPLTNNEIIYRGSILRNTAKCLGLVVYSGEETRIRMNANKNPRIKAPSLQSLVNKIVIVMVFFVLFLAFWNSIAYQLWQETTEEKAWYVSNASVGFGPLFTSFIIMFNTLIPLSLYVSLEIIKVSQMVLLNDIDMYDGESNTPFEARTSTINEELGQVGYIFSDKTGTLTENVMKFRKLSVAGTSWLHDADLKEVPEHEMMLHKKRSKGKGRARSFRKSMSKRSYGGNEYAAEEAQGWTGDGSQGRVSRSSTTKWRSGAVPAMPQTERSTDDLIRYLQERPHTPFASRAKMMLLCMALCHTCLPERSEDDEAHVTFQASSPDELALVEAAKELGYLAFERDAAVLSLKVYPDGLDKEAVLEKYEIVDVIEFSSKRKRMSVVVRLPDSRVVVICKGADSAIMKRLRLADLANQKLAEVEKRTHHRKSMEAQEALRRKSSLAGRSGSVGSLPRTSTQLSRISATLGRTSTTPLGAIRDEVDGWLNAREYGASPRVSSHFRTSTADRQGSLPSAHVDVATSELESAALRDEVMIERCLGHVNDYATEGLRTLLYGYRYLTADEYNSWKKVYHDATTSLIKRTDMIEQAAELIEKQMELGGATAIEDKLQKGVPETIDRLRRANIKMWMLTGDKRETAINIAHSCRLIKDFSSVVVLDYEAGDVEETIAATILDISGGSVAHSVIVIDGQTLSTIQSDHDLHELFLDLAVLTDSVVCCRASPSQKAGLVHAVRTRVNKSVTLAIGDGANDVAMIQEAHVGIGITGKEGLQAARTSDYSIAQFRFLTKLLLVHGRWNYIRTCKYTVGTFSKEMMFYLTQALYQRYNGYSGTSLYESWSLSMFNTLFTSLPVIFLGIFEQDLRASTLIAVPELYTKGQRAAGFNLMVFLGWMFIAVSEAVIIFFTMFGLYGSAIFSSENTIFPLGNMTFTACVIVIAIKLQIVEQRNKSIMAFIAVFLAVGGWFLWNIILGALYKPNLKYNVRGGIFQRWGESWLWWLSLIVIVVCCALFEIGIRVIKAAFWPTDVEIFQTLEQDREVRKRFEEASAPWMQQGWDYGSKKSSVELEKEGEEQEERELEVQKLLSRPRTMEAGGHGMEGLERIETEVQPVMIDDEYGRTSIEISEMLSRRFGSVRRETMTPPS